MAQRKRTRRKAKVPFPRRQWQPGQAPRTEKPKAGKGSYDRRAKRQDVRSEADQK
jgi:hypothetical protein